MTVGSGARTRLELHSCGVPPGHDWCDYSERATRIELALSAWEADGFARAAGSEEQPPYEAAIPKIAAGLRLSQKPADGGAIAHLG